MNKVFYKREILLIFLSINYSSVLDILSYPQSTVGSTMVEPGEKLFN